MVYSTCSLSVDQNENVVQWLLGRYPTASLIPVDFPSVQDGRNVAEGSLKGTVRFYPSCGQSPSSPQPLLGEGFFVAKLRKSVKEEKSGSMNQAF
jgi:16S rRNA C967 or C1407 C5-methylase (RsmB/RsmF family)